MSSFNGSTIIPEDLADALIRVHDIIVDKVVGIQCLLYKYESEEDNIYGEGERTYSSPISTMVYIDWKTNLHKLKSAGANTNVMSEDNLPFIGHMLFEDEVPIGSIISIPFKFQYNSVYTHCLELIDRTYTGHNIEVKTSWIFAPVRDSALIERFTPWTS